MAATNRLYADAVSGTLDTTLGPNPGTDLTISGAFVANLPVIADPNFIALTLDPETAGGAIEIVWVTSHTASATTATVQRAKEGTTARQHLSGTKVVAALTKAGVEETVALANSHAARHASGGADPLGAGGIVLSMLAAAVQQALVPAGTILATGRTTAPSGFLLCQGQAVSRTTYADLFSAISTVYGAGDGSTTFNLPNLQGRFPLGKATSGTGSSLGSTGGNINHSHTGPSHTHTMNTHSHTGPSHTHTMGTHIHTMPTHSHTSGAVGNAVEGAQHASGSTRGLFSYTFASLHVHTNSNTGTVGSHTHTDPATSSSHTGIEGLHSHFSGGNTGSNGGHSHTMSNTGGGSGTGGGNAYQHTHSGSGSTGSVDPGDTNATDPGDTNAAGTGTTSSVDPGDTNAAGTGATGTENPPFQVVNYMIKT